MYRVKIGGSRWGTHLSVRIEEGDIVTVERVEVAGRGSG